MMEEEKHRKDFIKLHKHNHMSLRENIIRVWKNKGQILEGVTNSIFKKKMLSRLHNRECRYVINVHF